MKDEKNILNFLKEENDVPKDIADKLEEDRISIFKNNIGSKKYTNKKYIFILLTAAIISIFILFNHEIASAFMDIFGISNDIAVSKVEEKGIDTSQDIISESNSKKITLTKFVSTPKKYAFDYKIKLSDDELNTIKELINKQKEFDPKHREGNQDIEYTLSDSTNKSQETEGGYFSYSTYRIEGNTLYGSVISTFTSDRIAEEAKLFLNIKSLSWGDYEILNSNIQNGEPPYELPTALKFEGDWIFKISNKPVINKSKVKIFDDRNINNISVDNDALQTTVKFSIKNETSKPYYVEVYNGEKVVKPIIESTEESNGNLQSFEITIDFSSYDKSSIYKFDVKEVNDINTWEMGETKGSFKIRNVK
ncbi:hypothetical protein BG262_04555 [Floricoccus penangensis]|uniref:Uncharacterized protein n=1 Tax=Floricoccus penangensis TaxID=1859475 RepID=A0A9Q5NZ90_9LACT|nr:hypothetical protein [Floricoccus penangensis]OFI46291.1 hypothetical protein BG262_04555 [Floricoccus penangensis]